MTHLSTIGAGMYSDLAVTMSPVTVAMNTEALFVAAFATEATAVAAGNFQRIKNVRTFPAVGTPANIVKVPTYGSPISQQVNGQADAPNMELTINYVAADWAASGVLGALVADGQLRAFRFALLNAVPSGYASTGAGAGALGGPTATPVENTEYYWLGKIVSLLVNPQLTDANTCTVTIAIMSKMAGGFTVAAAA